jgi:hypothetical protein
MILISAWIFLASIATAQEMKDVGGYITYVTVGKDTAFILQPHIELFPEGFCPWLWFAPECCGGPHANHIWLYNNLLREGWTIIGLSIGETRGEPAGREKHTEFTII